MNNYHDINQYNVLLKLDENTFMYKIKIRYKTITFYIEFLFYSNIDVSYSSYMENKMTNINKFRYSLSKYDLTVFYKNN